MPTDRRSSLARAYAWASRATSIAIGMLLPGFVGYGCDRALGVLPWLTLAGFTLGFAYGVWRLAQLGMTASAKNEASADKTSPDDTTPSGPPAN